MVLSKKFPVALMFLAIMTSSCGRFNSDDDQNESSSDEQVLEDWQRRALLVSSPERFHKVKTIESNFETELSSHKETENYNENADLVKKVSQYFYKTKLEDETTTMVDYNDHKDVVKTTVTKVIYNSSTGKEEKKLVTSDEHSYEYATDGSIKKERLVQAENDIKKSESTVEYKDDDSKKVRAYTDKDGNKTEVTEELIPGQWNYAKVTTKKNGKLHSRKEVKDRTVIEYEFVDGDESKSKEVLKTVYTDGFFYEKKERTWTDSDGEVETTKCKKIDSDVTCTYETKNKDGVTIEKGEYSHRQVIVEATYKSRVRKMDFGPTLKSTYQVFTSKGKLDYESETIYKISSKNMKELKEYKRTSYEDDGLTVSSESHTKREYKYDLDGTRPTEEIETDVKTGKVRDKKVFKY